MSEEVVIDGEESDGIGYRGDTVSTIENRHHLLNVKTCKRPMNGKHVYPMDSNPRGFCLIFNIFSFKMESMERKGSEAEAKRLKQVFQQLLFTVDVVDNPTKFQVLSTVEEYSQMEALKTHNAFIMIVLSHGRPLGFLGSDLEVIDFEHIVDRLNNKNCPNLINKPKLLIFSCCRGDKYDFGVISQNIDALGIKHSNSVSDAIPWTTAIPVPNQPQSTSVPKTVPMISDIMICYSTINGHVSYRCQNEGTWLGTALSRKLLKHSHDKDLCQILAKISRSINKRQSRPENAKQAIELIFKGFEKSLYFNPGYFEGQSRSVFQSINSFIDDFSLNFFQFFAIVIIFTIILFFLY